MQSVDFLPESVWNLFAPISRRRAQKHLHLPPVLNDARYPDFKLGRQPLAEMDGYARMNPCALKMRGTAHDLLNQFRYGNSHSGR